MYKLTILRVLRPGDRQSAMTVTHVWEQEIEFQLELHLGGAYSTIPYWTRHEDRRCMAVQREEAELLPLPRNEWAETLWGVDHDPRITTPLHGVVVIVQGSDALMDRLEDR